MVAMLMNLFCGDGYNKVWLWQGRKVVAEVIICGDGNGVGNDSAQSDSMSHLASIPSF